MKTYKWLTTAALSLLLLTGCTDPEKTPNKAEAPETEEVAESSPAQENLTKDQKKRLEESEKADEERAKMEAQYMKKVEERFAKEHPDIAGQIAKEDMPLFTESNRHFLENGLFPQSEFRLGMPIEIIQRVNKEPKVVEYEGATRYSVDNFHYSTEIGDDRIIRIDYELKKPIPVASLQTIFDRQFEEGADGTLLIPMNRATLVATIDGEDVTMLSLVDGYR